ncbi:hypothetical protein EOD29_00345 [Mesorhizobium sp. M1A.T.Ca.IN.004.03.1.1]|uniref:hypothetical protein n=1 Tax=Mesorhizobium sp. M1A.T.Ca.IN.004.03.1.1 TaxID=2496795 RepID=UPI000FCCD345|nr:hypothetical protein [Mesorhizobium sp. M1A.T.Ca.IN.004.03.1.1]RUV45347.1 hypothetical protein EOD29_00345 [Mesorhizobium sp. M1A.T.Ca.IN.004.03.1.1]
MFNGLLAILAFLAAVAAAHAEDEASFGSGVMASKCSRLVEGMDDNVSVGHHPLAFAMLSWAEGYITATNMELIEKGEQGFDLNSVTGVELWASLYGFCKRNPDQRGVAAVIDTMGKLKRSP